MVATGTLIQSLNGGVRESVIEYGPPDAYAAELARYIRDASTVRVRVMERFGKAPDRAKIEQMIARHRGNRDHLRQMLGDAIAPSRIADRIDVSSVSPAIEPGEFSPNPDYQTPREVVSDVARYFRLSLADLTGRGQFQHLVNARQVAAVVLRQRGMSSGAIGRVLGGRDHSTVLNLLRKFEWNASDEMRALAAALIDGRRVSGRKAQP